MNGPTAAPAATAAGRLQEFATFHVTHGSLLRLWAWLILLCPMESLMRRAACRSPRRKRAPAPRSGVERDPVAGPAVDAIAHHRLDFLAIEPAIQLRVGAGRLDHDDVDRQSAARRPARNARDGCRRAPLALDGARARGQRQRRAVRRMRRAATSRQSRRSRECMFIAGEPMKPATNGWRAGRRASSGSPVCSTSPSFITTILSAIVIASIWSCVT